MNGVLLFFLGATLLIVLGTYALGRTSSERSARPVLPSQYDPENYVPDETTIPGWCRHCETMNESGYRFCQNCSARLPDVSDVNADNRRYWFSRQD